VIFLFLLCVFEEAFPSGKKRAPRRWENEAPSDESLLNSTKEGTNSSAATMNASDADRQIKQMVNFILQEAQEKANEIRIKVSAPASD
jgi:hypothetical protein